MTDQERQALTIDRIVGECVEAGMPTGFEGTLRGSLADAWRAALAAREEPPHTDDDACPECGVAWLQWKVRAEQAEARLAAREEPARDEEQAWNDWHPLSVPDRRDVHRHGFNAGQAAGLAAREEPATTELLSICHGAVVRHGGTGAARYYVCSECGEVCGLAAREEPTSDARDVEEAMHARMNPDNKYDVKERNAYRAGFADGAAREGRVDRDPSGFDDMVIAMEDAAHQLCDGSEDQSSHFYETILRAALAAREDTERPTDDDLTELVEMPRDLARLLKDPSVIIPQDAAVFDLIAKWRNAPTPTMSGPVRDTERPDRRLADPISGEEIAQGRGEFRIADSPAQERAGERLKHERGSIRAAFDGLGLGWDYEDVWDYCNGSVSFRTLPRDRRGIVAGMLMGFAIVVAERVRDTEQEHEG